jgi:hypothetical protein
MVLFLSSVFPSAFYAQTSCPPPEQGCPSVTVDSVDVDISGYTGIACTVPVKIAYCIDKSVSPAIIKVTSWDVNWASDDIPDDCRTKLNQILLSHLDKTGAAYTLWHKDFYIHMGNEILKGLIATKAPIVPSCASGGAVGGHFYLGSCISNCTGQIKLGKQTITIVGKGDCSSDICCFLDNKYCIENGNVKKLSSDMANIMLPNEACDVLNSTPIEADCNFKPNKPLNVKITWIKQGPCSPICTVTKPKMAANNNINLSDYFTEIHSQYENTKIDISLFPNPTTSNLNVYFSNEFTGKVAMFDIVGREIFSQDISNLYFWQYSLSDIDAGVYAVKILSKNGLVVASEKIKIVK